MANFEHMVPFIIKWETGTKQKKDETNAELFERARTRGFANDPADTGGATQTGVTIATYREYCKKHGIPAPSIADLKALPYEHWLDILKTMYWDRWQGDKIHSQSVAEICVDWVWASGKYGITEVQKLLNCTADGIVGPKTLAALNGKAQMSLFYRIKQARHDFIQRLVRNRPSNAKFLKGWQNRINDIKYQEG